MAGDPQDLERAIGHVFGSRDLLERALTHSSAVNRKDAHLVSNERLEFLGDRVLGLALAELLHERFPDEPEGALAKRFAALSRREALDRVAEAIGLPPFIAGDKGATANPTAGLVADACEALIAALFLDAGYAAARAFVRRAWDPLLEEAPRPPRDSKTLLQEWAQGRGLPLPVYAVVARRGPDHAPTFEVRVEVAGLPSESAEGASKRAAEREAARRLVLRLGIGAHDD